MSEWAKSSLNFLKSRPDCRGVILIQFSFGKTTRPDKSPWVERVSVVLLSLADPWGMDAGITPNKLAVAEPTVTRFKKRRRLTAED
jgi:hypothetical protein